MKPPIPDLATDYRPNWPNRAAAWLRRRIWWLVPVCFMAGAVWEYCREVVEIWFPA